MCVAISSGGLTTREGYQYSREVTILFEETFFNQRDESYRVLCLEQPLEGAILDEPVVVELESLEDCVKFLWSDSNTYKTRKKIDGLLVQFSLMEHEQDKPKKTRIQVLVDVCRAFFAHALHFASRDGNIRKQIHGSGVLKKALYQSIETYIMSQVFRNVFKEVCVQRLDQDAELNTTTRKLSDITPHQLGVKAHHQTNLVDVRDKLSQLNNVW
ncbi:ankyrin repeat domain-containing protein 27-like isoform X1 [Dysidea avara]|uniref:ankyrin repeat domain-containing protein 27-like isoform X1 n=1 Tax=Dysidea avara TaxID=196820 RepID=UPI00332617B5